MCVFNSQEKNRANNVRMMQIKHHALQRILFTEEQLISVLKDLFSAGVETTNNTIGFIITHLAVRQDVQGKVHEEIERVLGKEVLPRLAYKNQYVFIVFFTIILINILFYSQIVV